MESVPPASAGGSNTPLRLDRWAQLLTQVVLTSSPRSQLIDGRSNSSSKLPAPECNTASSNPFPGQSRPLCYFVAATPYRKSSLSVARNFPDDDDTQGTIPFAAS